MEDQKEQLEKQYICIDPRCEQSNRMFKSKNDSHAHKSHDYQLYSEFQKLIKGQFPQQIKEQINAYFSKDELTKSIQSKTVQMHEYIKNFEENLIKQIDCYDVLGVEKATLIQMLTQLFDPNPPQTVSSPGLMSILKFSKLGPQKVLDKWKKEIDILNKEIGNQVDTVLKVLSNQTLQSYMHIQHLQSPQILLKLHFNWSSNLKANSVTIREESIYEKGNNIGLVLMDQLLEKDQIQSITLEIKERSGNVYIGVIDYHERRSRGRTAFQFHDWNELNHGLYLLYHGGYVFSSNEPQINAKQVGFPYDQGDKIIMTWNGPEHQLKIFKVGNNQQMIFKVNPEGQYHFAAGLFKAEIRILD